MKKKTIEQIVREEENRTINSNLAQRSTHTAIASAGMTEEVKKNFDDALIDQIQKEVNRLGDEFGPAGQLGTPTKNSLDELQKKHDLHLLWGEKKNADKPARPNHPIPLQDRILITKTKPEEKIGSIYIPEIAIQDNKTGVVVAIGPLVGSKAGQHTCPGIGFIPQPGDLVEFGEYAGTEITYKEKKYLIMREADILCILP